MKPHWLSLFIFVVSFTALAQKAEMLILDDNIDDKELKKDFNIHRNSTHQSSLPNRKLRNQTLERLDEVKNWDSLRKDFFYVDLKQKSIIELHKKYPEVPLEKIKKLKEKI